MERQAESSSRTAPAADLASSDPARPAWEAQLDPETRAMLRELRELRVALVHDWLVNMGGGERVLAVLHQMFPKAPIYTTILDRTRLLPELRDADIRTAFTNRLPMARSNFRALLPLYPWAVRQFDLRGYDLVISSSSAFAKGVRVRKPAVHVCYCHTPMRFAWQFDDYVAREALPRLAKLGARALVPWLRRWDRRTSEGVDVLIANSEEVRQRIRRFWGREARVIHPPVDVDRFQPAPPEEVGDYFLVVSRLVAYRRIDIAARAAELAG